jgi:AraC-like DNA-binding protein
MQKRSLPVYKLNQFSDLEDGRDFYANNFIPHLQEHHFVNKPHKHDFYVLFLFTKGKGTHEIDFSTHDIKPGSVFFLSPGQSHNWQLSDDIDGYVFFHSQQLYDLHFSSKTIRDYPFFDSIYSTPVLHLKPKDLQRITIDFEVILQEYRQNAWFKNEKMCNLIDCTYIDLARLYLPSQQTKKLNQHYLNKLREFENLIDTHYKTFKYPKEYAEKMNMSEKHLNRICKTTVSKTTGDVIIDRVLIEAKRLLVNSKYPVARVAEELGYSDHAYFSRLFKKRSGETPLAFSKRYK